MYLNELLVFMWNLNYMTWNFEGNAHVCLHLYYFLSIIVLLVRIRDLETSLSKTKPAGQFWRLDLFLYSFQAQINTKPKHSQFV